MITKSVKAQTADDAASLVGTVALTILAAIIVTALYLGREIFVLVALAILLSFVAETVGARHRERQLHLQRAESMMTANKLPARGLVY